LVENEYPCAPKRAVTYAMFQEGRKSARIAAKSRRDDPLLTVGFNLRSSTQRSGILRLGTLRSECLRSDTLRSSKTHRNSIPLGMHRSVENIQSSHPHSVRRCIEFIEMNASFVRLCEKTFVHLRGKNLITKNTKEYKTPPYNY